MSLVEKDITIPINQLMKNIKTFLIWFLEKEHSVGFVTFWKFDCDNNPLFIYKKRSSFAMIFEAKKFITYLISTGFVLQENLI